MWHRVTARWSALLCFTRFDQRFHAYGFFTNCPLVAAIPGMLWGSCRIKKWCSSKGATWHPPLSAQTPGLCQQRFPWNKIVARYELPNRSNKAKLYVAFMVPWTIAVQSFAKTNQKTRQCNLLAGKNSRQSAIISQVQHCGVLWIASPSATPSSGSVRQHTLVFFHRLCPSGQYLWCDTHLLLGVMVAAFKLLAVIILWIINVKYILCMFAALSLMQHCALNSVRPHAKKVMR